MVTEELIDYEHNGAQLEGLLARDDADDKPRPAVFIAHAWRGRSEFERNKARELADLGYAGFAMDLFGKGVLGSSVEENRQLIQPFVEDRALLQSRMTKALEILRAHPAVDSDRVVAIGFCFGGMCVLDLARIGTDIGGVVSFHGLLGKPDNVAGTRIKAKVLVLHGHEDPMVPVDDVIALENELTDAGADWQIHVYGNTMHAFTNPQANDPDFGTVYNADADRRSWRTLINFLDEVF